MTATESETARQPAPVSVFERVRCGPGKGDWLLLAGRQRAPNGLREREAFWICKDERKLDYRASA